MDESFITQSFHHLRWLGVPVRNLSSTKHCKVHHVYQVCIGNKVPHDPTVLQLPSKNVELTKMKERESTIGKHHETSKNSKRRNSRVKQRASEIHLQGSGTLATVEAAPQQKASAIRSWSWVKGPSNSDTVGMEARMDRCCKEIVLKSLSLCLNRGVVVIDPVGRRL